MRTSRFVFAAIVWALSCPSMAAPPTVDSTNLRQSAAQFGECVVRTNAALARGFILQDLTLFDIKKIAEARRLMDPTCIEELRSDDAIGPDQPAGMRFESDLFRYSLADALVRADYPKISHFDFTARPQLTHSVPGPLPPDVAAGTGMKAKQAQVAYSLAMNVSLMSRFGECAARRNPDGVHELLLTKVNTAEERAVFSRLSAMLGQCLVEGQMRISREVARGSLALGFYRLAGAPAGAEVRNLRGAANA
ncbi:hypothetical protein KRR38_05215 [Novosphingobium sp. G106]|uniref:hypothetical protein n=1 Tax=Novosphingobium sp. G106 TaxID=2849500 RepID=UPI001C2CF410|nr:hypothetical protein [Novosphingobium sp. G106]MBV1687086.1 hypothetical protein [Novosphingobium sp. G106]